MEDLSRNLSKHPFIAGLEPHYVEFLTGCAANVVFRPGEQIFREGGAADRLILVRTGEAALQVHSPGKGTVILSTIGPGDVAGWSWAVPPYVAHFDVLARSEVRAFSLDADCLRRKCQTDPEFGYHILVRMVEVMEERLQATRLQLVDFYGPGR